VRLGRESDGEAFALLSMRVAREIACAHVHVTYTTSLTQSHSSFVCVSLEGIWNALPNSRGVVKTNLIKALLENRGCRWISNSNSEVKR